MLASMSELEFLFCLVGQALGSACLRQLERPFQQRSGGTILAPLSQRYPEAVGNIVTVGLRDGRVLSEGVDYPRGHSKNPLTDAEVEGKFHTLADSRLGRERAEALLLWLWRLEEARSWDPLVSLMEVSR